MIDPNNFKQIQDVLAKQRGTTDGKVTGAAHALQKRLQDKKHKKKKPKHKASPQDLKKAVDRKIGKK